VKFPAERSDSAAVFSGGEVYFGIAAKWPKPPTSGSAGTPPTGLKLPHGFQLRTASGTSPEID
jgi:hypothetical protein